MHKFKLGDTLFLHNDNSEVIIIKAHKYVENKVPLYLVRNAVGNFKNELEYNLCLSNEVIPGAVYRVHEIVFAVIGLKYVRQVIVDVFHDTALSDQIVYKCKDADGEIGYFTYYEISLYNFPFDGR